MNFDFFLNVINLKNFVLKLFGLIIMDTGQASYLYLFNHTTENGYYTPEFGSVHGEDLAYVLGMPLGEHSIRIHVLKIGCSVQI